jgi:MFS transporter, DHA2 family, multidrug resistance protein
LVLASHLLTGKTEFTLFTRLASLREQQSSALAYFNCFWLFAVLMLALIAVVFFMKRSVTEKITRIGGK